MKGLLHYSSGGYRICSAREDGKAAVPLPPGPHNATSVPAHHIFNYSVVPDHGRTQLIGVALPKLSTPLYIGKEESHRAGWEVGYLHIDGHLLSLRYRTEC
jgi:hypothetical protein